MKALIVDDNMLNIKVIMKLLEKIGCSSNYVTNGFDCIKDIKNNSYDVIFMDIMMPEMDGVETFKKLKSIDKFDIPIVAQTADAVIGAREKYLSIGFDEYISKPIHLDELKNIINKIS